MYIPPVGKGAPKGRVQSRCGSGRKLKAANLEEADCYMTYNTLKYLPDGGKNRVNRDKEHVRRLMFCFADLDTYRMAPEGCDMKRFNEGIVQELEGEMFGRTIPCPSYIIFSGRGMYFLWKVDEHVNAYPRWVKVQKYLHEKLHSYGSDGAVTTDSARVLRVIGSINSRSGERVGLLRDYKKSYTLYEIMTEYMQQESRGITPALPVRRYYMFHWGNKLYADRMGDLKRLLLTYRDRGDAYRENILFLYRYYHLCMHGDKEKALKAVKRLNASLKHPLPENEAANATKVRKSISMTAAASGFPIKKLLRFLNIKESEMDALHSIKSDAALKEEKRKKNRQAYARRLQNEGKKPKNASVHKRRMEIRKLLLKGKKEQEICRFGGRRYGIRKKVQKQCRLYGRGAAKEQKQR